MRITIPNTMKYFCVSEQTANYLQKYIVIRKRKIFSGQRTAKDLIELIKKHKTEKFIFPCSSIRKNEIPNFLEENSFIYVEAIIYETAASDLSDLADVNYDVIAFYSPSGIQSLFKNSKKMNIFASLALLHASECVFSASWSYLGPS